MADDQDAERDLMTRAVLAEAGGEPDQGQTGVAAVILNRSRANSQPVASVIAKPGAFEAWGDAAKRSAVMRISTTDPAYQRAAANVDAALNGSDPTGGAVNFLNPTLQAQRGRPQPDWATGQGVTIGKHVFYGGSGGMSDAELYSRLTNPSAAPQAPQSAPRGPSAASAVAPTGDGSGSLSDDQIYRVLTQVQTQDAANAKRQAFADYAQAHYPGWNPPPGAENYYTVPQNPGQAAEGQPGSLMGQRRDANGNSVGPQIPLSDAQTSGVFLLKQSGKYDPNAPSGSAGNPWVVPYGTRYPDQAGDWYFPVDSANPRQVGDSELAYNKRLDLQQTPAGQAALADARATAASQYGNPNDTSTGYAFPIQRALNQVGAYTDTLADNAAAGFPAPQGWQPWGVARPYGPGQASDAAYVASTERAAQEYAQRPRVWEGNALLGDALESIPLAEVGGNLLTGAKSLGPIARFAAGASDGSQLARFASPIARDAILGAGVSGTQGYVDTGDPNAFGRNFLTGGAIGAGFGLGARTMGAGGRAILGNPISDETANLAQMAQDKYGIPLRASQITNSPTLRTLDSVAGVGASDAAQKAAFNRGLAQTVGEDAPALTKPVMAAAKARIGQVFEDVANRTTITADNQFLNDLAMIENDAKDGPAERIARNRVDDVFNLVKSGTINGPDYLALTRQGGVIDRAVQSSNADVAEIGRKIRGALDDALERSASPNDVGALSTARQQWKAMATLEPLAAKAGPDGLIEPSAVLPRVASNYATYAYNGTTPADLGNLAEIGTTFLKQPWGGYSKAGGFIKGAGGLALEGTAAGLVAHNPELAGVVAVGAPAAAMGAAKAGNAVLNSAPAQRWLSSNNYARVLPASTEQRIAPIAADVGANMLLQTEQERREAKSKAKNPLLMGAP